MAQNYLESEREFGTTFTQGRYAGYGLGTVLGSRLAGGFKVTPVNTVPQSLGVGRAAVKQWLQTAGNLERAELVQNIEYAGFKLTSKATSPVTVFERGGMRIRLGPPQGKTPYNHMHLEYGSNSYNIFLNPVNYKSPAAHIPIK